MTVADKRLLIFAISSFCIATILLLFSGFSELAWFGFTITITGIIDLCFFNSEIENWVEGETNGDVSEELWGFRSFAMMILGPFVILFALTHA